MDPTKIDRQEAEDEFDSFTLLSLFGENRREMFGDSYSGCCKKGGRFFTKKEMQFLVVCGRTPAKSKKPIGRERIVVRLILLFPSIKRMHPMKTNSLGSVETCMQ
jgi:hypothetical protein